VYAWFNNDAFKHMNYVHWGDPEIGDFIQRVGVAPAFIV
jgi:hypothetical protein